MNKTQEVRLFNLAFAKSEELEKKVKENKATYKEYCEYQHLKGYVACESSKDI